jgi:hypothetical protein
MKVSDQEHEDAVASAVNRCTATPLAFILPDPENPNLVLSMWTVKESGNFWADQVLGLTYAEDLIRRSQEYAKHTGVQVAGRLVLEGVMGEIVRKGTVGPIELGFLSRIAMAAMVGALN